VTSNYRVGYGKPPRQYQFKPGQSGNRKGRPKGAKTTATLLRELLDRKITIRSEDAVHRISIREAMLTRFAEAALKDDTKCASFLLQRYDALQETDSSQPHITTAEDREIIETYFETYLNKKGVKP
jgi:hypothetical protein